MIFPLQWSYEDYPESIDEFLQEILTGYTNVMPLEVVATLFFGTFALATYVRQDSPIIVLGFIMMAGAPVFTLIAPVAISTAMLGVMLFGSGVMFLAYYIYSD